MSRAGWTTSDRRVWRKRIGASLPKPCTRCGITILPGQTFDVDHILEVALGGTNTASNLGPSHPSCNRSAGAALKHKLAAHTRQLRSDLPNL
jgi:hypothetical protein